jgi:branched-chain amino acid transport system substrate-binding protein
VVRRCALVLALVVGCSCTGGAGNPPAGSGSSQVGGSSPPRPPAGSSPHASPDANAIGLDVVAASEGLYGGADRPYLDGMRLAVAEVNSAGGVAGRPLELAVHDDGGDSTAAATLLRKLIGSQSPAVLYVGEGPPLSRLRVPYQRRGKTVFLLKGDLYTTHSLFRQVFQTTIPWEWQANVIARYLVRDRRAGTIGFIGSGEEADAAQVALQGALSYWGGRLAWGTTYESDEEPPSAAVTRAARADAVVVFGSPPASVRLGRSLAHMDSPPRIAGGASLLVAGAGLPPGTVACYPYTWAGWAEPIRRVRLFGDRLRTAFGRDPSALEQEGYDAVRLLAEALARTGGTGGRPLTAALEAVNGRIFSAFPIEFGPDDHVMLPRDELGLFAIAGPDERVDPWQMPGSEPWRPLMRTFTYDGQRTSVLDMDRRVFFPSWRKNQPGPEFWRSRYGIRTRASKDGVH